MKLSFILRKDGGTGRRSGPPSSHGGPPSSGRKGGGGGGHGSSGGYGSSGGKGGPSAPSSTGGKGGPGAPNSSGGKGGGGSNSGWPSSGGAKGSSGSGRGTFSTPDGRMATSFSNGGGPKNIIPAGSLFSGREQGGGSRMDVYGTRQYGSGYPGVVTRGVANRGFPFYFWPVIWGRGTHTHPNYLHSREYGDANNSSRLGGPLYTASFQPIPPSNTYTLISDHQTIDSLIDDITSSCPTFLDASSTPAFPYNPDNPSSPQPEEVIQYYRASSVALTLQGYNNSAVFETGPGGDGGSQMKVDDPLPNGLDLNFLDCLNSTIGHMVPLVSDFVSPPPAQIRSHGVPCFSQPFGTFNSGAGGLLGLVWVLVLLM